MSLHKQATELGITTSNKKENEEIFRELMAISKEPLSLDAKRDEGHQAANRLVEGNMAYVVSKVESFLDEYTDYNYLKDDLISEGFLTLARVADNLITGEAVSEEDFNPQAMMSVSLRNALLNLIRVEREVPLTAGIESTVSYDETAAIDLKLDIMDCCENDREREIVRLRCEGWVDPEIADRFNVTKAYIGQIREALYQRLIERQGDDPMAEKS